MENHLGIILKPIFSPNLDFKGFACKIAAKSFFSQMIFSSIKLLKICQLLRYIFVWTEYTHHFL